MWNPTSISVHSLPDINWKWTQECLDNQYVVNWVGQKIWEEVEKIICNIQEEIELETDDYRFILWALKQCLLSEKSMIIFDKIPEEDKLKYDY